MPHSPPYCVIYNPSAGRGSSTEKWKQIQELLGSDAVFRPTERAWHGAELAQQAIEEGFSTIVAAGGDGTVHEVINGVVTHQRPDTAFSVFPLGSGNDYARAIGMPFDPEGMVQRLRSKELWPVDIGEVTLDNTRKRNFCNTIGIGLGGAVTCESRNISWLRGIPLYGLASLKAIWKHLRTVPVHLIENGKEQDTTLVYAVVAIGKEEGGGFVVAAHAKIDDGQFELLYLPKLTRLSAMYYLPLAALGWLPGNSKAMQRRSVTSLTIQSEHPLPAHADGEILATPTAGVKEFVIKILPGKLKIRGRELPSRSA
jgi:diacylglycerol kinase (ATP)